MSVPSQIAGEVTAAIAKLRANGFAEVQLDGSPTPSGGGFWAEIWKLPLAESTRGELPALLVMRIPPDEDLAAWETTFQRGVAEQGFPTPTIRAFNFRASATERVWSVMDYSDGRPMLAGLSGLRAIAALPRLAKGLPDTLARAAARLHQLDPKPIQIALATASTRKPGVEGLLSHYEMRANEIGDARLQRAVERLVATQPAPDDLVPCHGDLHPFNVLTTATGYLVLDWTNGQIAHREFDLAYTHLLLSNPPLAAPQPAKALLKAAARQLAKRFLKTYRSLSPRGVDEKRLDWYRTLHACRVQVDISGWRAAGTSGDHQGHPWFALEPTVAQLLKRIG